MKKTLLLLTFAIPGLLVVAQNTNEREPYLVKSLANENIKTLKAETSGGSISVMAVGATEARIEVFIKGNNGNDLSKEEIRQRLMEKYDLAVSVAENKLTAIAKSKKNNNDWKHSLSISFKIFVPRNVSVDLATSGGNINLSGVVGDQDFTTSGGNLEVDNVSGKVRGTTSGGNIHVEGSSDDIELSTSGGNIFAKQCKGKLKLTTSGGSIDLSDLNGTVSAITSGGSIKGITVSGELSTHTSGGSIRLDNIKGNLDASTSGGNIDISVVALGKYVKIRNSGGDIDLELPKDKGMDLNLSASKIKTPVFSNFTGKFENNRIEGKVNGGGIPIDVSSNGRMDLAFK